MNIITSKGTIDTNEDFVILLLNNEDEYSAFMTRLATNPVKTSGMRVVAMVPEGKELTPLQTALISIVEGLDGVLGKENDKIIDDTIDKLTNLINQ